ncbi:hypothetical protein B0T10DRAFT_463506 [Thelonectria olida]|uniref:Uncharacterized protein n=1 Tax=Thelonectria olida TaxID=1576542 RepID=A0A9P8W0A7_9HYPO|nr:hypothetical protein B0T10DRAFT_463506 [Thelonectria olida]
MPYAGAPLRLRFPFLFIFIFIFLSRPLLLRMFSSTAIKQANFARHHDPSRHLDGAQSDLTHPTSPAITYTSRKKNRPRRATTSTWKVKEAGSWNALLARAGQSSHKVRKKKKKYTQRGLRRLLVESTKDEGQTQNRFLDAEGEFVGFPSVEEVCAFSSQDWDKLFQALDS